MRKNRLLGLGVSLLLAFALALSACGGGEEAAPELPPADLNDVIFYGYSIGVPDYYSSNGIVYDEDSKYNSRVSEIEDQAVLSIIRKNTELEADEFTGAVNEEFSDITGLDTAEMTAEETEISGLPGLKVSGTDPDGNEVRAVMFMNDVYKTIVAVTVKEYSNDTEKEHAYISDFELIPETIRAVGPEEHFANLGYRIDFPDYYEKFVPFDMGTNTGYVCYSGDANLDMTFDTGKGEGILDSSVDELEESLIFEEEMGVDVSTSDEVEKGPARIIQYSYSYPGMTAGGTGALIYDTEKDVLISINLMVSGNGDSDTYIDDFNKMIEAIEAVEQ